MPASASGPQKEAAAKVKSGVRPDQGKHSPFFILFLFPFFANKLNSDEPQKQIHSKLNARTLPNHGGPRATRGNYTAGGG